MKFYGLKHIKTNQIVRVDVESNGDAEFSVSVQHSLCLDNDSPIWMLQTKEKVEDVLKNPRKWYNAGYNAPSHDFTEDECEVVEIELNIRKIPKPKVFIKHDGGRQPVGRNTIVEVVLRDGFKTKGCGYYFRWKHVNQIDDIMEYRIIEEEEN